MLQTQQQQFCLWTTPSSAAAAALYGSAFLLQALGGKVGGQGLGGRWGARLGGKASGGKVVSNELLCMR